MNKEPNEPFERTIFDNGDYQIKISFLPGDELANFQIIRKNDHCVLNLKDNKSVYAIFKPGFLKELESNIDLTIELIKEKKKYIRKVCLFCGNGFWVTSDINNQRFCCIGCLDSYKEFKETYDNDPILKERLKQLNEENEIINKQIKDELNLV